MTSESVHACLSERMAGGDPYYNYCYWPYEPVSSGVGKLRPSSLLFFAVGQMKGSNWLSETLRSIQVSIGDFRSVYGIKRFNGEWALEVYVYDYQREDRLVSIERLASGCQGQLTFPQSVGAHIPYFMFSFDLDESVAEQGGRIDDVHVYIGNPGSSVSSGISYRYSNDPRDTELENFYFFFDARDRENIEDKIRCAAFLDEHDGLTNAVFTEQLADCGTVCLANKRMSNTVYYSGIDVEQLKFFLAWQNYPDDFRAFVDAHEGELDHLLFDVGVDYRVEDNAVRFLKSGIYGIF